MVSLPLLVGKVWFHCDWMTICLLLATASYNAFLRQNCSVFGYPPSH